MLEDINNFLFIFSVVFFILIGWPILLFGAPFLPSFLERDDIDFGKLSSYLKEKGVEKVLDLGSGDGRLVSKLAEYGFESHGVEINPVFYWISKWKLRNVENAFVDWGNFWNFDLSGFDAVFIFQFDKANELILKKIREEMKDGSIIISVSFKLDGLELIEKISRFNIYRLE